MSRYLFHVAVSVVLVFSRCGENLSSVISSPTLSLVMSAPGSFATVPSFQAAEVPPVGAEVLIEPLAVTFPALVTESTSVPVEKLEDPER